MPMRKKSARRVRYTRKSFFVDSQAIGRARKALGAGTDAETVRLAVERVVEMEKFWRFMTSSRGSLKAGSIEAPWRGQSSTPASTLATGSGKTLAWLSSSSEHSEADVTGSLRAAPSSRLSGAPRMPLR